MELHSPVKRDASTASERLSPGWILYKGAASACCEIWSHVRGFEVRLREGANDRRVVCSSHHDLITVCVEWRRELIGHGWTVYR